MPRKAKTIAATDSSNIMMYRCHRCGKEHENPVGFMYKIVNSPLYKANNCYCPLCKDCVSELFQEYTRRYNNEKTACILLCHALDIPFYHTLFESIVTNNNTFSMGLYLRQMNNRQYQYQNFATTLVGNELQKSDTDIRDQKEEKWTTGEVRNKNEVIKIIGYDPFDGYASNDRRYLFGELAKYLDEDIADDPFKLSQIIQIIINNNQIRQYDLLISRMNPTTSKEDIKVLNEIKNKLVASNDKIAKENEISVKNRSNKEIGRNTLTFLMKDLREKDFAQAEANFYDQLRSTGTQWAANMSLKAIKENAFFDENDEREIFDVQRQLIEKFQAESDEYREKYRLLLIEVDELRKKLSGKRDEYE